MMSFSRYIEKGDYFMTELEVDESINGFLKPRHYLKVPIKLTCENTEVPELSFVTSEIKMRQENTIIEKNGKRRKNSKRELF